MDLSVKLKKDKGNDRIRVVFQKLNYLNKKVNLKATKSFTVYSGDIDEVFDKTVEALREL